jgi:hypothetical protein
MHHLKFNGVLQEIIERYPNIDIVEFLQDKLQISMDSAEELATRIENYYLKDISKTKPNLEKIILEKPNKSELPPKAVVYSVDCLSEKEFERFTQWLLEEIGYEIHPEKYSADSGVDLVATKDGEKIAIQVRWYPKNRKVSNSIILKSQETKPTFGCNRSIVAANAYFTQQATVDAQKLSVELWDRDTLAAKITKVRKKAEQEEHSCFPPFKESLLQSLLRLEETKDFMIEPKADGKYDLHLPGVKFPLLTFHAHGDDVIRCVFRIKYNEPVGEFNGEPLISVDRNNDRFGPDGANAYALIIKYLEQFVE